MILSRFCTRFVVYTIMVSQSQLIHLSSASSIEAEIDDQTPYNTSESPSEYTAEGNGENLSVSNINADGENINARISSLSTDPDDVQFFLYYDPRNPNASIRLVLNDTKRLRKAKFRPGAQVIFITHGFMSGYNLSDSLAPTVKNAYLSRNTVNIIAVDWQRLAKASGPEAYLSYYAVIKRTPIVGNRIADFIIFLIQQGKIKGPQDVHLVGHSLGAHVSGIAGNVILTRTGNHIDRITGLDPAGPLYEFAKDDYRLDETDADFVDILHTAIGTLGSGNIHGHVDFFANGGRLTAQTGCLDFMLKNAGEFFSSGITGVCSHSRAYEYFARSIRRTPPELYGCRCDHRDYYIFFIPNECVIRDTVFCEDRTLFGEYIDRTAEGNFYLDIDEATNRRIDALTEK